MTSSSTQVLSIKRKVLTAVATLTLVGGVGAAAPGAAGAATHECGSFCISVFSSELGTYDPFPPAIVVPLGPDGGSGQLPGAEEIASRETVSELKGRHLMVEPVAAGLGLETAKAP